MSYESLTSKYYKNPVIYETKHIRSLDSPFAIHMLFNIR